MYKPSSYWGSPIFETSISSFTAHKTHLVLPNQGFPIPSSSSSEASAHLPMWTGTSVMKSRHHGETRGGTHHFPWDFPSDFRLFCRPTLTQTHQTQVWVATGGLKRTVLAWFWRFAFQENVSKTTKFNLQHKNRQGPPNFIAGLSPGWDQSNHSAGPRI